MKKEGQKLRLLYVLEMLWQRTDSEHALNMEEILQGLEQQGVEAQRKGVYADIRALQEFGFDIVVRRGNRGGYQLVQRDFELAELKLLVDAVQCAKFITHKKSRELIEKMAGLSSHYEARRLQRQVYVANRVKVMNESIYYNVDALYEAISQGKMIRFLYFEWVFCGGVEKVKKHYRKEGTFYQVSPLALHWDDENYYLIAYDDSQQMVKHYRVDKMENISPLEQPRSPQALAVELDVASYSRKIFGMYGGEVTKVRIRFANRLIGVVLDRFGRDCFLTPEDEEHFCLTTEVAVSPQFLAWVLGFGAEAKILSPSHVAQQLCSQAKGALAQYETEK